MTARRPGEHTVGLSLTFDDSLEAVVGMDMSSMAGVGMSAAAIRDALESAVDCAAKWTATAGMAMSCPLAKTYETSVEHALKNLRKVFLEAGGVPRPGSSTAVFPCAFYVLHRTGGLPEGSMVRTDIFSDPRVLEAWRGRLA